MPDPSPLLPADSSSDPLLERCILAHEDGQLLELERLMAQHPERAAALRAQLQHLRELGILMPPRQPQMPERLGDFRLLRPLGKGGMGLVYLAVQESLQREVALKLVRPEQLYFPDARERFRREVLAVARLNHPGIVPVYTFGEADGVPFYAMARVHGVTLGEILQALQGTSLDALDGAQLARGFATAMQHKGESGATPVAPLFEAAWARAACQIVRDMALALQHAHQQGVLHRDVKPSNAILTADGHVHLIDFGLASARGESRITRSGATLGSLPYMAPEQVRGDVDAIDARTDVYALGVTLYELLTLMLPHGDGSGTTRERILNGSAVPPTLRNARVHADADAICMQAMEVEPARRYQSAAGLAADLQRFLDLEPVKARRQTSVLRARRWLRRHPAHATAALLAFLLVVVGPLVFGAQQSFARARIHDALQAVEQQKQIAVASLAEAQRQQQRALTNLDRALAAVDLMLSRTAQARLADIPRTAPLRKQLLQDALRFHETLAASESGARTQEERARSRRRVGQIQLDLGEVRPAIEGLEQASGELRELLAAAPDSLRLHLELADAASSLAQAYYRLGQKPQQYAALQQAIVHWQFAVAAKPEERRYQISLLCAQLDRLRELTEAKHDAEAFAELDRLDRDFAPEQAPELQGADLEAWLCAYARIADSRGVLLIQKGDTGAAAAAFETALQRLQRATEATPDSHDSRAQLAGLYERLAMLAQQRREWLQARPRIDAAIGLMQQLADDEPEMPEWQLRLATMIGSRADNRSKLDDADGAKADHDRSVAMLEQLAARYPDEIDCGRRLAIALGERGMARAQLRQLDGARADFERSTAEFERLIAGHPEDNQLLANLVATLANTAQLQAMAGDVTTARQTIARALELNQGRSYGESERSRIEVLMTSSDLAMRDLDVEQGQQFLRAARELATAWLAASPDDRVRLGTVAMIGANYGTMQLQMRDNDAALATFLATLDTARRAATGGSPANRRILAVLLLRLCDVNTRLGDTAAARRWLQAAIAETGVTKARVADMPPLDALFDRPELRDLVPNPPGGGK